MYVALQYRDKSPNFGGGISTEICHGNRYLLWGSADTLAGALGWKDGSKKGLLQKNCKTSSGVIWMSLGFKSWPFNLKGVFDAQALLTVLAQFFYKYTVYFMCLFWLCMLSNQSSLDLLIIQGATANYLSSHLLGVWMWDMGSRRSAP